MSDLRFYSFTLMYLSSIQNGIQSGHALGEMMVKYNRELGGELDVLWEFLTEHKTWIVLNGGITADLYDLLNFLIDNEGRFKYPVPFAPFREDVSSLDGIMTCVGLIIGEEYFAAVKSTTDETWVFLGPDMTIKERWEPGTIDHELVTRVKSCGLAR